MHRTTYDARSGSRSSNHSNSSAFSPNANPNEDWTKISDLAERRRIQNRIAQRNYRKFPHSLCALALCRKNYTNAYIRRQEAQAPSRGSRETCCFFGISGTVSCRACTSKGHQQIPPQATRQQIRRCENAAPIARHSSGTTSILRVLQRS